MNNLRDALKSDDGDRIKKTMEILQAEAQKLGEEIYKATGAAPGGPGDGAAGPGPGSDRATAGAAQGSDGKKKDEDVIDAEFEVKE